MKVRLLCLRRNSATAFRFQRSRHNSLIVSLTGNCPLFANLVEKEFDAADCIRESFFSA